MTRPRIIRHLAKNRSTEVASGLNDVRVALYSRGVVASTVLEILCTTSAGISRLDKLFINNCSISRSATNH